MPMTQSEYFKNAGNLLKDLGEASKPTSDGGIKITVKELIDIAIKNGVEVAQDITDDDDDN